MTDNEIISAWRGERRHEVMRDGKNSWYGTDAYKCNGCGAFNMTKREATQHGVMNLPTDYSNDPAAWGPELFEAIEKAGLWQKFLDNLIPRCWANCPQGMKCNYVDWLQFISDPEQKARALAMAIKEVER